MKKIITFLIMFTLSYNFAFWEDNSVFEFSYKAHDLITEYNNLLSKYDNQEVINSKVELKMKKYLDKKFPDWFKYSPLRNTDYSLYDNLYIILYDYVETWFSSYSEKPVLLENDYIKTLWFSTPYDDYKLFIDNQWVYVETANAKSDYKGYIFHNYDLTWVESVEDYINNNFEHNDCKLTYETKNSWRFTSNGWYYVFRWENNHSNCWKYWAVFVKTWNNVLVYLDDIVEYTGIINSLIIEK